MTTRGLGDFFDKLTCPLSNSSIAHNSSTIDSNDLKFGMKTKQIALKGKLEFRINCI